MRIIFKERRSRLAHALNLRVDGSISYLQGILDKSRGLRLLLRPLLWYARHHIEFASSSWGKESCWSIFGNWRSSGLQKTPSSFRHDHSKMPPGFSEWLMDCSSTCKTRQCSARRFH